MTLSEMRQKHAGLTTTRDQLIAQLNQYHGAIGFLEALIAEEEKRESESASVPEAKAEGATT